MLVMTFRVPTRSRYKARGTSYDWASPVGVRSMPCAPYGIALAAQVCQDAVRPLHLLCAFRPSNGLAHAKDQPMSVAK